jgi:hypothetical protein
LLVVDDDPDIGIIVAVAIPDHDAVRWAANDGPVYKYPPVKSAVVNFQSIYRNIAEVCYLYGACSTSTIEGGFGPCSIRRNGKRVSSCAIGINCILTEGLASFEEKAVVTLIAANPRPCI